MHRIIPYFIGLFLWLPGILTAQRVIYSETLNNRSSIRFQVIGKSGNYYWVEKLKKQKSTNRRSTESVNEIQSFGLLDARLNLVSERVPQIIPGTLKQWLVCGEQGLDQIIVTGESGKTQIISKRYLVDMETGTKVIDSLPFSADASCLLLVRSGDRSKILIVAFDNTDTSFTNMHAILFDSDWNRIYHEVISREILAQPCIQDEEIGFPAESFDNLPIKLANNGEWLMASPSGIGQHFSIFHACPNGSDYYFREVKLSPFYKMEDIAMSIDNDQQEMSVGLLSGYKNTSLKNVQVFNYSMKQGRFDFDSSYHFNTQARALNAKNLSHESFISVAGGGFMYLKEYGQSFEFRKPEIPLMNNWETAYLLANYNDANSGEEKTKPGYTLNHGLSPIPIVRNRGDLNMFYFPAIQKDSTWSGVMEMEQHAETNNPDLSYLFVPAGNKLYVVYNNMEGYADPLATTTTLNKGGQVLEDALIFWSMNKKLNFQKSRRFAENEVAVPYLGAVENGFAIIRLQ